ncbi:MAG: ROK family protein [Ramlibacter sp.]|nr:ROK family protein [Ramlibacter sp.]
MRFGIDLGGTKIEGAVLDEEGGVVARHRLPTPAGDYGGTVAAVAELVGKLEAMTGQKCLKAGIGSPGAISPATGLMKNCNSTCLNARPLLHDLESSLGCPVRISNDANCFALSEAQDGAGVGVDTVFGVILGTGVGAGIVVNGKILVGANAIAGEWGHNPLPSPNVMESAGRACYCGRSGCIETWLSGPSFAVDARAGGFTARDAVHVVAAMRQGDPIAIAAFERYVDRLARALGTVINTLDPDVIVLGGGLSNVAELYGRVAELIPRYVFSDTISTRVVPPVHGDSSGVRGAAWLWPSDGEPRQIGPGPKAGLVQAER